MSLRFVCMRTPLLSNKSIMATGAVSPIIGRIMPI